MNDKPWRPKQFSSYEKRSSEMDSLSDFTLGYALRVTENELL